MFNLRFGLIFLLLGFTTRVNAEELALGDFAPSLDEATWPNGKALKSVVPGNVYVFTFFNSSSDMAKATFTTVSEIASQFQGNAVVVGVNVDEKDAQFADAFCKQHAPEMKFDLAVDSPNANGRGPIAAKWLDGIAFDALPLTFVIDAEGKVAFIGRAADAKTVVARIINGDFTAEDAKKFYNDEIAAEWFTVQAELDRKPLRLQILGDNVAAATEIQGLITKYPRSRPRLLCEQFYCLMRAEKYDDAYRVVDGAAHANARNAMELNELAWFIVDEDWIAERDLDRAMAISARSVELEPHNGAFLDTLARVHFEMGDIERAYDQQLKAVEYATPRDRQELLATLDRYRNALPK